MRHARSDYDRIQDPAGLIPEDEPVFLIRAQDKIGPLVVREWAKVHYQSGGDIEMSKIVRHWADTMEQWQRDHTWKLADVPPNVRAEMLQQLEIFDDA